jgi:hypothetical protein
MAGSTKAKDLKALQRIISQAALTLDTIASQHPSMPRVGELL